MSKVALSKYSGSQVNDSVVLGAQPLEGVSRDQIFDIIENDDTALQSLNSEYWKFEDTQKNKTLVFFITDVNSTAELDGRAVPVIKFEDREGNQFINGDTVFVGACKRLQQIPAFVKVRYKGLQRSAGKKDYKNFDVLTFAPVK